MGALSSAHAWSTRARVIVSASTEYYYSTHNNRTLDKKPLWPQTRAVSLYLCLCLSMMVSRGRWLCPRCFSLSVDRLPRHVCDDMQTSGRRSARLSVGVPRLLFPLFARTWLTLGGDQDPGFLTQRRATQRSHCLRFLLLRLRERNRHWVSKWKSRRVLYTGCNRLGLDWTWHRH